MLWKPWQRIWGCWHVNRNSYASGPLYLADIDIYSQPISFAEKTAALVIESIAVPWLWQEPENTGVYLDKQWAAPIHTVQYPGFFFQKMPYKRQAAQARAR